MWTPLAFVIMVASVVVGVWCLVSAGRGRFLNQPQYSALLAIGALVLVQTVIAATRILFGDRPVELVTFIGYLLTTVLIMPVAIVLLRAEPTKWGSIIGGGAAATVAALTLRLVQVWSPLQ